MSEYHVQVQNVIQNWKTVSVKATTGGVGHQPFDIMFKLVSSAVNSTSWVLDTTSYPTRF